MSSKKDIAIKKAINDDHILQLFYNYVYIREADDAIIADSLEECMKQINDPCHIWQGQKSWQGYGVFGVYYKDPREVVTVKAHRLSYALEYGFDALPKGMSGGDVENLVLNHICHNRLCIKPTHLEVITRGHNLSTDKRKPKNV